MQPAALHHWQLHPGATVALETYRLCNANLLVHACKQSVQKSSSRWGKKNKLNTEDSQQVSQAVTYIIPFHKFVALSQALGDGHRLELQRMNSRLCPCHWLMYSSRRTAAAEMSHFTLFIFSSAPSCNLLKSRLTEAPLLLPVCHARTDGGGGASRLWRAVEGGRRRSGPGPLTTGWLTERKTCS